MIKDTLNSLKVNLGEKLRNPFWGTYIIVFVIHYWQLFYSLIYVHSSWTLAEKICTIEKVIEDNGGIIRMVFEAVGLTFLVLLISSLLLLISLWWVHFYDSVLRPLCIQWGSFKMKMIEREKYDHLEKSLELVTLNLQKERAAKFDAELSRDQAIQKEINEKKLLENELIKHKNDTRREYNALQSKLIELRAKTDNKTIENKKLAEEFKNIQIELKEAREEVVDANEKIKLIKDEADNRQNEKYQYAINSLINAYEKHNVLLEQLKEKELVVKEAQEKMKYLETILSLIDSENNFISEVMKINEEGIKEIYPSSKSNHNGPSFSWGNLLENLQYSDRNQS